MKLTIDTVTRTIEVGDIISIPDFIDMVQKLFPNDWQFYMVIPTTQQAAVYPYYPYYPYYPNVIPDKIFASSDHT